MKKTLPCPFCKGTNIRWLVSDIESCMYCEDCNLKGPWGDGETMSKLEWNKRIWGRDCPFCGEKLHTKKDHHIRYGDNAVSSMCFKCEMQTWIYLICGRWGLYKGGLQKSKRR